MHNYILVKSETGKQQFLVEGLRKHCGKVYDIIISRTEKCEKCTSKVNIILVAELVEHSCLESIELWV